MSKIIRVEMEFEDGRIQRLSEKEAAKWLETLDGQCMISAVHGMSFPSFEWEVIREGKKDENKTPEM